MTLDEEQCWARLAGARHGVLATVHRSRGVDAVPVVFAVRADRAIVIPIDTVKPKASGPLQRLVNIEGDARCVVLVDHYDDDWSQLWWVRVHAVATASPPGDAVLAQLADRYPTYREAGSVVGVITLRPTQVSGWSASRSGGLRSTT